jgi:hypothetical protein
MRRALITALGVAVLANAAHAASIRFFLSHSSDVTYKPSTIMPHAVVTQPQTLYLWAEKNLYDPARWNGLSLGIQATGSLALTDARLYNPNMGAASGTKGQTWQDYMKFRWQNGATTSPPPGTPPLTTIVRDYTGALTAAAVSGSYLLSLGADPVYGDNAGVAQDQLAYASYVAATDTWLGYYKLGEVTAQGSGYMFLTVGAGWITASGGSDADQVYFGYGDAAVNGRQTGAVSASPEASYDPEPATGLLLVLAGLLMHRR